MTTKAAQISAFLRQFAYLPATAGGNFGLVAQRNSRDARSRARALPQTPIAPTRTQPTPAPTASPQAATPPRRYGSSARPSRTAFSSDSTPRFGGCAFLLTHSKSSSLTRREKRSSEGSRLSPIDDPKPGCERGCPESAHRSAGAGRALGQCWFVAGGEGALACPDSRRSVAIPLPFRGEIRGDSGVF